MCSDVGLASFTSTATILVRDREIEALGGSDSLRDSFTSHVTIQEFSVLCLNKNWLQSSVPVMPEVRYRWVGKGFDIG